MIQSIVLKNVTPLQDIEEDQIISTALKCLENRLRYDTKKQFKHSKDVSAFLRLQLAQEQDEVFAALFLNCQLQLIAFEKLFFGTINHANIHARKVVKKCIEHNASKLIIAHNHPSQNCTPSEPDREITKELKNILKVIDVELTDHFIVTPQKTFSFAANFMIT